MWASSKKLEGSDYEVLVIVGTDLIKGPTCGKSTLKHGLNYCGKQNCEESELIHDLKRKYLVNFENLEHVHPISFKRACEGELIKLLKVSKVLSIKVM